MSVDCDHEYYGCDIQGRCKGCGEYCDLLPKKREKTTISDESAPEPSLLGD